jgi:hypothetical protein
MYRMSSEWSYIFFVLDIIIIIIIISSSSSSSSSSSISIINVVLQVRKDKNLKANLRPHHKEMLPKILSCHFSVGSVCEIPNIKFRNQHLWFYGHFYNVFVSWGIVFVNLKKTSI